MSNDRAARLRLSLFVVVTAMLASTTALSRHHNYNDAQDSGDSTQFDYYLMSLSWSPSFCETHPNEREQCGTRGYGFVLHGLWPQYDSGNGPQHCTAEQRLDNATLEKTLAFMPSRSLVLHEWETHGACTGLSPGEYFTLADRAFASIKIPSMLNAPEISPQLTAAGLTDAFVFANPGLERDMLAIRCDGQELSEVRICMSKGLQPQACGRRVDSQCRSGALRIPLVRNGH